MSPTGKTAKSNRGRLGATYQPGPIPRTGGGPGGRASKGLQSGVSNLPSSKAGQCALPKTTAGKLRRRPRRSRRSTPQSARSGGSIRQRMPASYRANPSNVAQSTALIRELEFELTMPLPAGSVRPGVSNIAPEDVRRARQWLQARLEVLKVARARIRRDTLKRELQTRA
jgi:hypothetical protein